RFYLERGTAQELVLVHPHEAVETDVVRTGLAGVVVEGGDHETRFEPQRIDGSDTERRHVVSEQRIEELLQVLRGGEELVSQFSREARTSQVAGCPAELDLLGDEVEVLQPGDVRVGQ